MPGTSGSTTCKLRFFTHSASSWSRPRDYCHYGMKTKAAVQIVEQLCGEFSPHLLCSVSSDYSRAEDLLNVRDEAARSLLSLHSSSSPSLPLPVCSLALGIECLFIFKHHKKYSSRRQATTMAGWLAVCTLQHTYTHTHRLNDIFALCPMAEAAAIFTPFCVVPSQAEPSVICGPGTLSIALVPQLLLLLLLF